MTNHVTITGRLGNDVELRFSGSGVAVANGRVAHTPRRRDDSGNWVDAGETLWLGFSIWDAKAEALAEAAHKGDLVTVVGELVARSWDAQDGTKRTVTEIKAREVAVVPRASAKPGQTWQGNQGGDRPAQPAQQQADPWSQPQQQGAWGGGGGTFPAGVNNPEPPFEA